MNKYEKEIEQTLLNNEKAVLKDLEKIYIKALADIKARLRLLMIKEDTQSVIYQVNYQKALEQQILAVLEILKKDNISNINSFLETMYKDGYIGIQYELSKQGLPVITPISQRQVINSLMIS